MSEEKGKYTVLDLEQLEAWIRSEEHKGAVLVSPSGPLALIEEVRRLRRALEGCLKIADEYYAFGLDGFDYEYATAKATLNIV